MTPEPLGPNTKTNRGFSIVKFTDRYDNQCSLQQSSLAEEKAIWLGSHDPKPVVMASDAAKVGVVTTETSGWVPYPIPPEVCLHTRMHLTVPQVKSLMAHLQAWLDTGDFEFKAPPARTFKFVDNNGVPEEVTATDFGEACEIMVTECLQYECVELPSA
jgi:hypothetical protein